VNIGSELLELDLEIIYVHISLIVVLRDRFYNKS